MKKSSKSSHTIPNKQSNKNYKVQIRAGTITHISLSHRDENEILQLLYKINQINKKNKKKLNANDTTDATSVAATADDDDDGNHDDDDDRHTYTESLTDGMKRKIIKKILRDDRKQLKDAKERKSILKSEQKKLKVEAYQSQQPEANSIQKDLSGPLSLQISAEKSSVTKRIVIPRTMDIAELCKTVQNKLKTSKKLKFLHVLPENKPLLDGDLESMPNDTHIMLRAMLQQNSPQVTQSEERVDEPAPHSVNDDCQDESDHSDQSDSDCDPCANDPVDEPPEEAVSLTPNLDVSAAMLQAQQELEAKPEYALMRDNSRAVLPMYEAKGSLLTALQESNVLTLIGETGCGKTTQVPQIILDDMIHSNRGSECFIICTQPRRIAAMSVAERVANERLESTVGDTVGYQIRLKSARSQNTRILYCTTGILLRKLKQPNFLNSVSHVIMDEVHERQIETDFLMAILRKEVQLRNNLKLILMSATLHGDSLCEYFSCPVLRVPGRCFPVTLKYMSDIRAVVTSGQRSQNSSGVVEEDVLSIGSSMKGRGGRGRGNTGRRIAAGRGDLSAPPICNEELIAEFIIRLIQTETNRSRNRNQTSCGNTSSDRGNAILVFLPGIQAIDKISKILRSRRVLSTMNAKVYMLHSSLPPDQQRRVFCRTKLGEWKVVLSTNIAESSVTVDDVTHVVDCGLVREMRFDPSSKLSTLLTTKASRASLQQRAGRAGRVRAGTCWRLFSEEWMDSSRCEDYSLPEIKRAPLEDVCLQILILKLGNPFEFLSSCLDPPDRSQIREALVVLRDIGAITISKESSQAAMCDAITQPYSYSVTPLGLHLSHLPVDVRLGKMLIYGCMFHCLDPVLTIAASLGGKSPLVSPIDKREDATRIHTSFCTNEKSCIPLSSSYYPISDHIAIVNMYNAWNEVYETKGSGAAYNFAKENYLSASALQDIKGLREQFRRYLSDAQLITPLNDNINSVSREEGNVQNSSSILVSENEFSGSEDIVRCVICAGLFPRLARVCMVQKMVKTSSTRGNTTNRLVQKILGSEEEEISIHPTSILKRHTGNLLGDGIEQERRRDMYLAYFMKVASPAHQIYDCTHISPIATLLFGESFSELSKSSERSKVIVNGWIHLRISELHAALIRKLRAEIESVLVVKVKNPSDENVCKKEILITRIVERILRIDAS